MKSAIRAFVIFALSFALSTMFVGEAFGSITIKGTIPVGGKPVVIVQPNKDPGATGTIKFLFSAPDPGPYVVNFCIGPPSNPCGLPTSYVVEVPGGADRLAIVNANTFATNELVAAQGTNKPVTISVTIE